MPIVRTQLEDRFIFQQDNCAVHVSSFMMEYFDEIGWELLEWQARSPDIDIIENIWSMLRKIVHDGLHAKHKPN